MIIVHDVLARQRRQDARESQALRPSMDHKRAFNLYLAINASSFFFRSNASFASLLALLSSLWPTCCMCTYIAER
jgi:hypothetical protein